MPIGTVGSHAVPYTREYPLDLTFEPVGDKGRRTLFCNYFLRREDVAGGREAGMSIKGRAGIPAMGRAPEASS